jgi:hypothetical protein
MSYDAEMAKRPLTGGELDEIILQEREQKHWLICEPEYGNIHLHGMPGAEYCELRDKYVEMVDKLDRIREIITEWHHYDEMGTRGALEKIDDVLHADAPSEPADKEAH